MSATYFGRKTEHRKLMEREAAEQARDDRKAINEGGDMSGDASDRSLVSRLKDSQPKGTTGGYLLNDAADRIQQLEAELKRKDEALRGIESIALEYDENPHAVWVRIGRVADKAREALK